MADINLYFPKLFKSEGFISNDAADSGGLTVWGITKKYDADWEGWKIVDEYKQKNSVYPYGLSAVKDRLQEIAKPYYKKKYWDCFRADKIPNQSLAEFIVDGGINNGNELITQFIQLITGVKRDGIFGNQTLNAVLNYDAKSLFEQLYNKRKIRYGQIVDKTPSQKVFFKGWMNRLDSIKFEP